MSQYLQMVVEAAKRYPGDLSDFQSDAVDTLRCYFFFARGWPPRPQSRQSLEALEQWFPSARATLFQMVERSWASHQARDHIRMVAALNRLGNALYYRRHPLQEHLEFITATGNELGMWQAWPQLHDVQRTFPLPTAPTASRSNSSQLGQILNINQRANAQLQAFQSQQAANIAASNWENSYWDNRYWNNR